jgi:hypothetical protein
MASGNQRVRGWQVSVIALSSALFFMGIPALGKPHHWIYWFVGFVMEAVIIFLVLRPTQPPESH